MRGRGRSRSSSLAVMVALLSPRSRCGWTISDAGNDSADLSSHQAFDLLAQRLRTGFNGPLTLVAELPGRRSDGECWRRSARRRSPPPGVAAVTAPQLSPTGTLAVMQVYPRSAPQAAATTDLVNRLRHQVLPPLERRTGVPVLVAGLTAGSIDFSQVLSRKLPLFIAVVVLLSALLLFVIFRSLVIPIQAALMNLLSIGGAIGATVAVFQWGWLGGLLGVEKGPVEPWIPLLMFAVVFGLSMDYEVFLVSRVREQWVRRQRRVRRGGRRHRADRTGDHRGRGDHGVRVPVVHARGPADDQGVRVRSGVRGVPRRDRGPLRAAAGGARDARREPPGGCLAGSTRGCRTSTSRARRRARCPEPEG